MDRRLVVLFVALIALVVGRGFMLMMSLYELESRQAAVQRSNQVVALLTMSRNSRTPRPASAAMC